MEKIAITFVACFLAVTLAANLPSENNVEPKPADFSEEAKLQIREASFRAISYLCLGEKVLPEIRDTICRRAYSQMFRTQPATYAGESTRMCQDCTIADPVCWDSCPQ